MAEKRRGWAAVVMKRVLVLAEGQTEEAFVDLVLRPHLTALGVHLAVTRIATKIEDSKRVRRGGHGKKFRNIRRDLLRLLGDTNAVAVTTLIDYYGLPSDFPGLADRPTGSCYDRVSHVERAFASNIARPKFDPHLVLHEFEGLLLCCPNSIQAYFPDLPCQAELEAIRQRVTSPEEINESRDTAPSKRLLDLVPGYDKRAHGPLLADQIGLPTLREHCPHFDAWVTRLEGLSAR